MKANGEFNATKILSSPTKYKWIVVLLADSINRVIQSERPKSYTIVAASLRGAVIAGAVWELLYYVSEPELYIIDHIGPRYELLESPIRKNEFNSTYCIYIGDFMIGGTEIKVVNSYCDFFGGKVKHAFIIGKFIAEDNLGKKGIKLHSLVNLKDCVSGLSYTLG